MRIAAFELDEPIPNLREPLLFAILRPWIDVNNVGSLTLRGLEDQFGARELGRFSRPGRFFDFTRYRPHLYFDQEGVRRINIPNTILSYAKREGENENDFLFLNLLEPHSAAEIYIDSLLRVLKALKVKKYCLLGSMYDAVPHTKPLIVTGGATGKEAELDLKRSGAQTSDYQGPTTITFLITQRAPELAIETSWFIVSLPQYVNLEEDYLGRLRLMEILNLVHNIPIDKGDFERGAKQLNYINKRVEKTPELKNLVHELENLYEVRIKLKSGEKVPKLPPELEEILLKKGGKDFGEA